MAVNVDNFIEVDRQSVVPVQTTMYTRINCMLHTSVPVM